MQHSLRNFSHISQNSEHSNPIVNTGCFALPSFTQYWRRFSIYDQFSPDMELEICPFWILKNYFFCFTSFRENPVPIVPFPKKIVLGPLAASIPVISWKYPLPLVWGEAYLAGFIYGLQRRWGVVQSVGHLTVNEDGEGSNPSAPAKFLGRESARGR